MYAKNEMVLNSLPNLGRRGIEFRKLSPLDSKHFKMTQGVDLGYSTYEAVPETLLVRCHQREKFCQEMN